MATKQIKPPADKRVKCPNCGRKGRVEFRIIGQDYICRQCGTSFTTSEPK